MKKKTQPLCKERKRERGEGGQGFFSLFFSSLLLLNMGLSSFLLSFISHGESKTLRNVRILCDGTEKNAHFLLGLKEWPSFWPLLLIYDVHTFDSHS